MNYIFDGSKYLGRRVRIKKKEKYSKPRIIYGTIKEMPFVDCEGVFCRSKYKYAIAYDKPNLNGCTYFSLEDEGEPIGPEHFILEIEVLPEEKTLDNELNIIDKIKVISEKIKSLKNELNIAQKEYNELLLTALEEAIRK